MKKINIYLSALLLVTLASCGESFSTKSNPKSDEDSFSYAVGLSVGKSLKKQGLEGLSYGAFIKGVRDAISKDSGYDIAEDKLEGVQRGFVHRVQAKKIKTLQDETKKKLEALSKEKGVTQLPSKAYYRLIKPGTGATPQAFDTVVCRFKMKNSSGKVVRDNSKDPKPFKAPLFVLQLTPLEEAFQKTPAGGTFEVVISNETNPSLSQTAESFVDMYGTTSFEVELISVIPGMPPKEAAAPNAPKK